MPDITTFFYVENDKVFLKTQDPFPAREIGTIKSSEEETIQYFVDRYNKLADKVAAVKKLVEEQDNKGSFLQKVLNLQSELRQYDGIGDFIILSDTLDNLQLMLEDYIKQNRKRNLEVKNILTEEAKSYATNPNWKEATEQLQELRQRWVKVGAVEKDHTEMIEANFQAVYDDFYGRKKVFYEVRIAMMDSRIQQYSLLLQKAERLNDKEGLSETDKASQVEKLITEWKSLENIPKEKYDELLKAFKKNTTHKTTKVNKSSKSKANKAGESEKKSLIDQLRVAKTLPHEAAIDEAKKIQQSWKAASHISLPKVINEEFFFLTDYIFERNFLENLSAKKIKGGTDNKLAIKDKMNLLRNLISRDEKERLIFEENMGKFNLDNASFDKMMGFKYEKQIRKVIVKQQLLADLQEEYKKIN